MQTKPPLKPDSQSLPQILVVDDEPNVLHAVSRCFHDTSLQVLTAASAAEALELLKNGLQVSLIISDYRMPGMNGVAFLQQVMQRWPDVKRVILSAYPDTEVLLAAVNEGRVDRFITKPWKNDQLQLTIQELLEEKDLLASVRAEVIDLVRRNKVLASTNQQLSAFLNNLLQTVRGDSSAVSPALSSSATDAACHQHLSPRECQILKALATGQKPKEIAHDLGISVKTVSTYKLRLCEKMGFSSDAALITYALTHRIISTP
jgi:DNA-binding NarL/FixJ family response regulator